MIPIDSLVCVMRELEDSVVSSESDLSVVSSRKKSVRRAMLNGMMATRKGSLNVIVESSPPATELILAPIGQREERMPFERLNEGLSAPSILSILSNKIEVVVPLFRLWVIAEQSTPIAMMISDSPMKKNDTAAIRNIWPTIKVRFLPKRSASAPVGISRTRTARDRNANISVT